MTTPNAPPYPPLATPEQYAQMTGTYNPDIGPVLDAASALIRRYCGWHVAPVVIEQITVDGSAGVIQSLPTLRLEVLHSISEYGGGQMNDLDVADIEYSRDGYLRHVGRWTDHLRGVVALIEHGFTALDAANLTAMCVTMAARAMASPFGAVQQGVGAVQLTLSGPSGGAPGGVALYPDQAAALDAYRLNQRP